jgi:hypothetical protein
MLRREHRNVEALDFFTRALALSPMPRVRAQVALAEQALGRWLDAERDLDAAMDSTEDPWIAKNRSALEEARGMIDRRLAWLTVQVDVPSAEAELDGNAVPCRVETRVVAGSSVLKVRASGYLPEERSVMLEPGQHVQQTLVLTPVASAMAPAVAPAVAQASPGAVSSPVPEGVPAPAPLSLEPSPRAPAPIGPISLVVAGGVGMALGAYFGVRAADFKNQEDAACVGGCRSPAKADWTDAERSATASTVAFGVGIVLASAGTVWWVVWNRELRKSARSIRLAPILGAVTGVTVGADL